MDFKNIRPLAGHGKKLYIETYGCQMNAGDSEIVVSLLQEDGYFHTEEIASADVILINTCSIRDNAEQRIWGRLREFKRFKKQKPGLLVGVIGCMAERLREQLMEREQIVDIVAGPDAYRDLPRLLRDATDGSRGVNVLLSREETYAEISPVRLDKNGVSAFIAIMRGCNNMCSYCVVPYTRGAERSRDPRTILREARELLDAGYREVTLLGQNVNSYRWDRTTDNSTSAQPGAPREFTPDANRDAAESGRPETELGAGSPAAESSLCGSFEGVGRESAASDHTAAAPVNGDAGKSVQDNVDFAALLGMVADLDPKLRVRFATSHPKDLSDRVLEVMATHPNLCRSIHLPAQSGSSRMLELMNRKYTREWYLGRIAAIRRALPDCAITTDLIAGFCSESEEDHALTLSLMREVGYEFAYMFKYSERPNTKAQRTMPDDISEEVKTARLNEIIALQNELSLESNRRDVGKRFEVLVEGESRRSSEQLFGRTSQNKVVVFDRGGYRTGDYVRVEITDCSSATLMGRAVE